MPMRQGDSLSKKNQNLRSAQRSVEGHFAAFCHSVDVEDGLGQDEADSGNLHGVAPLDRRV